MENCIEHREFDGKLISRFNRKQKFWDQIVFQTCKGQNIGKTVFQLPNNKKNIFTIVYISVPAQEQAFIRHRIGKILPWTSHRQKLPNNTIVNMFSQPDRVVVLDG
jgi:hypothetical protein